ncbi:MAG: helix-turn-helix domain-containing protein [Prevotella sp.]|nr:helix-turn-helix domain-containing protein [Prevotella sp.]
MKDYLRILYVLTLFCLLVLPASAIEERSFVVINAANGLADNSAQVVKCTRTGRIVISTNGNINFYDGKTFSHDDLDANNEYPLPNYDGHFHLYFDKNHHIWLKDRQKVFCLDLITERYIDNVDSVIKDLDPPAPVIDIFADHTNELWLLMETGIYSVKHKQTYHVADSLNLQDIDVFDKIIYMFYDNGTVQGVDTLGNIVCQVHAYGQESISKYSDSSVLEPYGDGFFQIRNGKKDGILLFFDTKKRTYETILELDYHLNNAYYDIGGKILYIPSEYGYWTYDPVTKVKEHYPAVLIANGGKVETDCNAVVVDHQGGLWIGTEKRGVLYSRPHSWVFHVYGWDKPEARKYSMMMDSLKQNISEFRNLRANCQFVDSRGWTWIGTRRGLYVMRPGQDEPQLFTTKVGLSNDVVHAVVEDLEHNIWVSTSCGICFFLIRDDEIVFRNNFGSNAGVPNESFENCKAMVLPDSTIIMQGVENVIAFKPNDLKEVNDPHLVDNIKPKLVRILVNGNDVVPNVPMDNNVVVDRAFTRVKHIYLKNDQNTLSLTFSALNYFRPGQTYYRVRVAELDNKWILFSPFGSTFIDNSGLLHFPMTNLKPGDYHIEVQTSMFPDMWEENIPDDRRFIWEVHVRQSWWRSAGPFVLMGFVLFALILANFILYNKNTRKRVKRNTAEEDIIRKLRYFVNRCNAPSMQTLSLNISDLTASSDKTANETLSPEFINIMLKLLPHITTQQHKFMSMRKLSELANVDVLKLYDEMSSNLYKNPRDLILKVRLEKSTQMLKTTNMSLEQIAAECGFYTPNYFMGNFFHEYKMTPKDYRLKYSS